MTISVQLYRIRIGHFNISKIHENKIKINSTNMTRNLLPRLLFLLTFSALTLPALYLLNLHAPENHHLVTPTTRESFSPVSTNVFSRARLGKSINKIQKIINGNRRTTGFKFAVWNCGRGLVQETFSYKLHEVKQFIISKKPHCFGIIETDFHSHNSRNNRCHKYSKEEIFEMLRIDGYSIILPQTWEAHGQARLIVYVSDDVKHQRRQFGPQFNHIPSITLEIGAGRATRTRFITITENGETELQAKVTMPASWPTTSCTSSNGRT